MNGLIMRKIWPKSKNGLGVWKMIGLVIERLTEELATYTDNDDDDQSLCQCQN